MLRKRCRYRNIVRKDIWARRNFLALRRVANQRVCAKKILQSRNFMLTSTMSGHRHLVNVRRLPPHRYIVIRNKVRILWYKTHYRHGLSFVWGHNGHRLRVLTRGERTQWNTNSPPGMSTSMKHRPSPKSSLGSKYSRACQCRRIVAYHPTPRFT